MVFKLFFLLFLLLAFKADMKAQTPSSFSDYYLSLGDQKLYFIDKISEKDSLFLSQVENLQDAISSKKKFIDSLLYAIELNKNYNFSHAAAKIIVGVDTSYGYKLILDRIDLDRYNIHTTSPFSSDGFFCYHALSQNIYRMKVIDYLYTSDYLETFTPRVTGLFLNIDLISNLFIPLNPYQDTTFYDILEQKVDIATGQKKVWLNYILKRHRY